MIVDGPRRGGQGSGVRDKRAVTYGHVMRRAPSIVITAASSKSSLMNRSRRGAARRSFRRCRSAWTNILALWLGNVRGRIHRRRTAGHGVARNGSPRHIARGDLARRRGRGAARARTPWTHEVAGSSARGPAGAIARDVPGEAPGQIAARSWDERDDINDADGSSSMGRASFASQRCAATVPYFGAPPPLVAPSTDKKACMPTISCGSQTISYVPATKRESTTMTYV